MDQDPKKVFVLAELSRAQAREERLELVLTKLQLLADQEELVQAQLEQFLVSAKQPQTKAEEPDEQDEDIDADIAELTASKEQLEKQLQELKNKCQILENFQQNELKNDLKVKLEELAIADESSFAHCVEPIDSLRTVGIQNQQKLDLLSKANGLNDLFSIWHEGPFGTINGLRLGTMPTELVEWNEINAAFGFAALLLDSIAKRVGFNFFVWRVLPKGSESLMVNVQNSSQTLNLFCNANWLWKSSFNAGISAFADCVDELADFARREDPSLLLPHKIGPSTVAGLSVHYSNSESWTRSMKYLLTDLKWLETWAVRRRTNMIT